jgi:hypothetical protein
VAQKCWAFLAADFEATARDAETAVARLHEIASAAASRITDELIDGEPLRAWLERQPEWHEAQRAMMSQLAARAALEEAGLPVPAEALETAQRAQSDFLRLGR